MRRSLSLMASASSGSQPTASSRCREVGRSQSMRRLTATAVTKIIESWWPVVWGGCSPPVPITP
jgi:hypothetical protein